MEKMLVVVFDDVTQAYEGTRALQELHAEGSISVYAAAVIAKDADGKVTVKQEADEGPIGTVLGMATGALVGVLGGPAGVIAGAALGTTIGAVADLTNAGVDLDFADDVGKELRPGKVAIVAHVAEDWVVPVETRMSALGGVVLRKTRYDVVDDQLEREIAALDAELSELEAEVNQAADEAAANLKASVEKTRAKLKAASKRARERADELEKSADAKVKAINEQIQTASAEAKQKLEDRAAAIKQDYGERSAKLKQASELTKEALAV